jgi:hypothetical protein
VGSHKDLVVVRHGTVEVVDLRSWAEEGMLACRSDMSVEEAEDLHHLMGHMGDTMEEMGPANYTFHQDSHRTGVVEAEDLGDAEQEMYPIFHRRRLILSVRETMPYDSQKVGHYSHGVHKVSCSELRYRLDHRFHQS